MAELFISYAKPNREQALTLADELRGRGFSVWIDQGGIGGAKNWSAEIVEAINACSTLILLLSPESIASRNVAKEVQLASEKGRNILPVVIEKVTLPSHFEYPLVGIQRVYFHDRPAILHALELLKGIAETPPPMERSGIGGGWGVVPGGVAEEDSSIRVAVLPFDDLSPKHDNQWFADGMMDELISTLGHLDNMKVPSRSDVLHYRERHAKTRIIAGELGVRYIIEGAVRKAGKKIRINAALIDTRQTEQLWANQFDGSFDDVFAFQESVSKSIAEALSLKLAPKEIEQMETRPTENAEAYELYLKGRHEQYYFTKESYLRALDLYEQAAKLDPKFALAYIGIASVCLAYYREYSKGSKWIKRAELSLVKAEMIAGKTSESLSIRALIAWLTGDVSKSISLLRKALHLNPKNYKALNIMGTVYQGQRNYSSATKAFRGALKIRESTMDYFNLLISMRAQGNGEQVKETANKALPFFDLALSREPNNSMTILTRAFVLLWAGRKNEAESIAQLLSNRTDLSGHSMYNLGCLFDALGKPELYITYLQNAIRNDYREFEQTSKYTFVAPNEECSKLFKKIMKEFEEIMKKESFYLQKS